MPMVESWGVWKFPSQANLSVDNITGSGEVFSHVISENIKVPDTYFKSTRFVAKPIPGVANTPFLHVDQSASASTCIPFFPLQQLWKNGKRNEVQLEIRDSQPWSTSYQPRDVGQVIEPL